MLWKHVETWRYSSTILDLGTRWRWVVSFTPLLLYPLGKDPGTHWIGGWLGPGAGMDFMKKRKSYPCRESNTGHPAHNLSLHRLSYTIITYYRKHPHLKQHAAWLSQEFCEILKIWKFSKLKITTRSHAAYKGDSATILPRVYTAYDGGVRPKNVVMKYMKDWKSVLFKTVATHMYN
jgi:hypothetical protein